MSDDGGGCDDILLAMESDKADGETDLRFLKEMVRESLLMGYGMVMYIIMARWSEIWRLLLESCVTVRPVEQTRSRMCPWVWVGKLTFWIKLKQFIICRNSMASLQSVLSMWMLKSPKRRMEDERALSWVKKSESSERKEGLGLGGR